MDWLCPISRIWLIPMLLMFLSTRFGRLSKSWTVYTSKATRSAVRFTECVHLRSERYPMRKSVHPPVKFELLPIGQNIIHKISSSSTSKNRPVFARGAASDYFPSDYAQWANPRTTILEKRIIDLGTSRRDCGLAPGSVWLISAQFIGRKRT